MGEEIAFENNRISDFQGLVTLTLTLDRVILHTIMHHSSTSTYKPNFIEIEETFCGRTDGCTDERTFETHFIRSTRRSRPKKYRTTDPFTVAQKCQKSLRLSFTHSTLNRLRYPNEYKIDLSDELRSPTVLNRPTDWSCVVDYLCIGSDGGEDVRANLY